MLKRSLRDKVYSEETVYRILREFVQENELDAEPLELMKSLFEQNVLHRAETPIGEMCQVHTNYLDAYEGDLERELVGLYLKERLPKRKEAAGEIEPKTKGRILFDGSHGASLNGIDQNWECLKTLLELEGYEFQIFDDPPMTYDKLKDYNALVMTDPDKKDILDSEAREIEKYVKRNDAGLLLVYDNTPFNDFIGDLKGSIRLRKIGRLFGISDTISYDETLMDIEGPFDSFNIEQHPITRGVKELYFISGHGLEIGDGAKALISVNVNRYREFPFARAWEVIESPATIPVLAINSKYRVAVMSVDDTFEHREYDKETRKYEKEIRNQCERFALNLFPWLCGKVEEQP